MAQATVPGETLQPIGIAGLMGRNGSDSSLFISDRQCLEAYNIDWYRSSLGHKRNGASAIDISGGTAAANGILSMCRHVPGSDETLAEFWTVDGASRFHRMAGSALFADPTVTDAIATNPQEVIFKSFNGKLYIAYDTTHNRMHVWDPVSNSLRRTSLDLPATPTLGAPSAGAVTDTRKYRVAWTKQIAGVTVLRSNLSVATASQALAAQQVVATRGAAPGEGETHWELYGASTSSSFGDYRLIVTTVIATTTATDNTATLGATVAPADGANTPLPSARYLSADDARLIMGGAWETSANPENAMAPKNNRVWWTSILGATDVGDDERVSFTGSINNYADVEEAITAISDPLQVVSSASSSFERGSFYVFSFRSQWKFVSTGDSTAPYLRFRVTGGGGCIHHKSLCSAQDDNGSPALYWWSETGPFRITVNGQQFIGEDIVDITETVNLDATIPCHTVFHNAIHQVWFFIATGSNLYPNKRVIFDTRLGRVVDVAGVRMGWALHEGESTKAYCSCMFSDTIGVAMGRRLKPHIGYTGATAVWKCDVSTTTTDNSTPFQSYIDSKSYVPWGVGKRGGMRSDAVLIANVSAGVTIQLLVYRDEGVETLPATADLTPQSDSEAELKVARYFAGSRLAGSFSFRCRIGDPAAAAVAWNLDAVIVPVSFEGDL